MSDIDEKEILKLKLKLYGFYKREYEKLEHKYYEIHQEKQLNDNPKNAARNCGFHGDGPYHQNVDEMQIEEASLRQMMDEQDIEISYLGLDSFLASLSVPEWKLVHYIYVDKMTFSKASIELGCSESKAYRDMKKILNLTVQFT